MTIALTDLTGSHDRAAFDSGSEPLDRWLRQTAMQHQNRGPSRTTVAVPADESAVTGFHQRGYDEIHAKSILGFYSLCCTQITTAELDVSAARKLPNTIPAIRLGRLAVAGAIQGQGFGGRLLAHAFFKGQGVAMQVGAAGMIVDAKDDAAARFYRHFGFTASPHNPRLLYRTYWP